MQIQHENARKWANGMQWTLLKFISFLCSTLWYNYRHTRLWRDAGDCCPSYSFPHSGRYCLRVCLFSTDNLSSFASFCPRFCALFSLSIIRLLLFLHFPGLDFNVFPRFQVGFAQFSWLQIQIIRGPGFCWFLGFFWTNLRFTQQITNSQSFLLTWPLTGG